MSQTIRLFLVFLAVSFSLFANAGIYAGPSMWIDKVKKGYGLLTDAKRNDVNTWLSNKEVLGMIADVPSRSVFKTSCTCADATVACWR